jgi:hypothetical protein
LRFDSVVFALVDEKEGVIARLVTDNSVFETIFVLDNVCRGLVVVIFDVEVGVDIKVVLERRVVLGELLVVVCEELAVEVCWIGIGRGRGVVEVVVLLEAVTCFVDVSVVLEVVEVVCTTEDGIGIGIGMGLGIGLTIGSSETLALGRVVVLDEVTTGTMGKGIGIGIGLGIGLTIGSSETLALDKVVVLDEVKVDTMGKGIGIGMGLGIGRIMVVLDVCAFVVEVE